MHILQSDKAVEDSYVNRNTVGKLLAALEIAELKFRNEMIDYPESGAGQSGTVTFADVAMW